MDKVAGLKEILQQDSKNAFARYGLAMEYSKTGEDHEQSCHGHCLTIIQAARLGKKAINGRRQGRAFRPG